MKKNKFYPLAGTAVFLLDQWIKDYVEKNLKMGEKRKLAEKLELRRVHNPGICLGVFANKPEKVKKLTEAGTGIVTVTQMLTLLGNNHVLKKQESHLRQRVRGVIWQTVIIKRRWLITSGLRQKRKSWNK